MSEDPNLFKARVLAKTVTLLPIIGQVVHRGRTTAMALRLIARMAEMEAGQMTDEAIEQELDFLMADMGIKG